MIIPKTNHKSVDLVEYNITNNKLKGAKANKEGLVKKVKNVENSIENLGNLLELQQYGKKKKKWNKEIEDIKTEEIEKKIKKLMLEQAERRKLIAVREKEKQEKFEIEEQLRQKELIKLEEQKNENKQKQLLEVKEKSDERKKYMEGIQELKALKKKKWLHEKFEEDFEKNVLIPESERIAGAISTHKTPVPSLEEIQYHIKKYKQLMQSRSEYHQSVNYSDSKRFTPSKFLQIVNDEENLVKEMEKIREAEKLDLLDRKKHYANLVRQLYKPLIKDSKPIIKNLPEKRRVLSLTPTIKQTEKILSKPKQFPKIEKLKEPLKINYLEQRRELRQKEAEEILDKFCFSADIDSLSKAKQIEEKTKQAEYAVKGYKSSDYNVEAEERLNKMLIESVKAKIDALNKIS